MPGATSSASLIHSGRALCSPFGLHFLGPGDGSTISGSAAVRRWLMCQCPRAPSRHDKADDTIKDPRSAATQTSFATLLAMASNSSAVIFIFTCCTGANPSLRRISSKTRAAAFALLPKALLIACFTSARRFSIFLRFPFSVRVTVCANSSAKSVLRLFEPFGKP
jgi:hypothetical protein